jgi:uncharacterized protein (DUF433 family)
MATKEQTIVSTPGIMGGKPRVSGTRITVETIYAVARDLSHSPAGEGTCERILRLFPGLTPDGLTAALAYKPPKPRKPAFRRWALKYITGVGDWIHFDGEPLNYGKLMIALNRAGMVLPRGRK